MATSLSSNIANQLKKNFSNSLSNVGKNIVQNMANNAKQNATQIIADSIVKSANPTPTQAPSAENTTVQMPYANNDAVASSGAEDVVSNAGNTESTTVNNKSAYKNTQDYIDDLNYVNAAADRRQSALDRLTEANYQTLREQQNQVKPTYDAARNSAYTASRISALGNNEYLANQGLAGNAYQSAMTGYSESARIQNDIALQNNLNYLNEQERSTVQALANAIRSAQNEYNLKRESIEQDREDMIFKLNSSYRDAEKTSENTRLTNLEKMWENGYELNAEEAQTLIDGYGTTAAYLYKNNPTGYVDYIINSGEKAGNEDLFVQGLAQKGYDFVKGTKYETEYANELEKNITYRVDKALATETGKLQEIVDMIATKYDVSMLDGDAESLAKLAVYSGKKLTTEELSKLGNIFGIDADTFASAQNAVLDDIADSVKNGTADSAQKQIATLYKLDTRTDEQKEADEKTEKVLHTVEYDKGDGTKGERIFVKSTATNAYDTSLSQADLAGLDANTNIHISIDGTTYEVQMSGKKYNVEGTSVGAKDGDLTVLNNVPYVCVVKGDNAYWYQLKARDLKKYKGDYSKLLDFLNGKGAVDPDTK